MAIERVLCCLLLGVLGCGSGDDDPPRNPADDLPKPIGPAEPPPGIECDPATERSGTYRATFTTVDGTCGDQVSALIRLDPNAAPPSTCMRTFDDVWSDDMCRLERSLLCDAPGVCNGCSQETVGITTQVTETGSVLSGLMTISLYDSDGTLLCVGTYQMRAERQ
jgi:hypothetical protein